MTTAAELTENSRQGFEVQKPPCIGPTSDLSQNLRWECGHVYDETPVGIAVYVRNDPVNLTDPDGRDSITIQTVSELQFYLSMGSALPYVNGISGTGPNPFDGYGPYYEANLWALYNGYEGADFWAMRNDQIGSFDGANIPGISGQNGANGTTDQGVIIGARITTDNGLDATVESKVPFQKFVRSIFEISIIGGSRIHFDPGQNGEDLIHWIDGKDRFRFNKAGELVEHTGKFIKKATGKAGRVLKHLRNVRPGFFKLPVLPIIFDPCILDRRFCHDINDPVERKRGAV
jgi:hypothetical protein